MFELYPNEHGGTPTRAAFIFSPSATYHTVQQQQPTMMHFLRPMIKHPSSKPGCTMSSSFPRRQRLVGVSARHWRTHSKSPRQHHHQLTNWNSSTPPATTTDRAFIYYLEESLLLRKCDQFIPLALCSSQHYRR